MGFKTFARSTEFVFDPGITAVVGPNGSGKSNIVDAMRWCLGEQSFSLLRSKKTSDVIFAGSDKRSRLGMAEVTIALDNTQRRNSARVHRGRDHPPRLPRRRQRVPGQRPARAAAGRHRPAGADRPRQTHLFGGRPGPDRPRPEHGPRGARSLFEEAAGITGYQIKRTVAAPPGRDATEPDARAGHRAELGPRLGYLRRQAERAREREQIAGDLRILLRDWYGFHWHTTLRELEQSRTLAAGLHARVEAHQADLAAIGRQIETLRSRQTELRAALGELHRTSSGRHREAEIVGRDLAVAQEHLRQVLVRAEESHRELAPMRVQADTLSARIMETESAIAAARGSLADRQANVDEVQASVNRLQREREQAHEALSESRRRLNQLQNQHGDGQSRLQQFGERLTRLQEEYAVQARTQQAAAVDGLAAERGLDTLAAAVSDRQARASAIQEQIAQVEVELAGLRTQLERRATASAAGRA